MATYKKSFDRDRLLGYGGNYGQSTDVDFDEEDVWMMMSSEHGWIQPKSNRVDPAHTRRRAGGLSMAFNEDKRQTGVRRGRDGPAKRGAAAASVPMNVPVWSSMVRAESSDSMNGSVELDREESEWVPPHEYLAREHKKTTKSVFEGVGRTLKGRDLSRVRDAVWRQTGFFG